MSPDDPLASDLIPAPLREALRHSPNNAPLLVHIGETVLAETASRRRRPCSSGRWRWNPPISTPVSGWRPPFFIRASRALRS
jgi:hypothetical protein